MESTILWQFSTAIDGCQLQIAPHLHHHQQEKHIKSIKKSSNGRSKEHTVSPNVESSRQQFKKMVTTKVEEGGTNINWQGGHQQAKHKTPLLFVTARLSKHFVCPLSSSGRAVGMALGDSKIRKTFLHLQNKNTLVKYILKLLLLPEELSKSALRMSEQADQVYLSQACVKKIFP